MPELVEEEPYLRTRYANHIGDIEAWITMKRGHILPPTIQVWNPSTQSYVELFSGGYRMEETDYVLRPGDTELDPEWYSTEDEDEPA